MHICRTEKLQTFFNLPEIKLSALLTLSYLIDDDEADILAADEEFDFLLDNIETARDSENHRDAYGYKLLELLHGLRNLTNNDENKRLLMEKGKVF